MDTNKFSTEQLLQILNNLYINIENGNISVQQQEQIWNALSWDKEAHKDMIKYLFTGYMLYNN